jgi:hypothetical protein
MAKEKADPSAPFPQKPRDRLRDDSYLGSCCCPQGLRYILAAGFSTDAAERPEPFQA